MTENTPKLITLCGSTKYNLLFEEMNARLTLDGNIILSVGFMGHVLKSDAAKQILSDNKSSLDKLHFKKIEISDEIFVIDPFGYIGDSTKNEIRCAKENKILIRYLSKEYGESYSAIGFYQSTDVNGRWDSFKQRLMETKHKIEDGGLSQMGGLCDSSEIDKFVEEAIAERIIAVNALTDQAKKTVGLLMSVVMRKGQGHIPPNIATEYVKRTLLEKI